MKTYLKSANNATTSGHDNSSNNSATDFGYGFFSSEFISGIEYGKTASKLNGKLVFTDFASLIEDAPYIPITDCVLEHLITTQDLTHLEKLFYILADSYSYTNLNSPSSDNNVRSVALPSKLWAKRLKCSTSQIFIMQKSLEDKGYFIISKCKNKHNQHNRNVITPTFPDKIFASLCDSPDNLSSSSEDDDDRTDTKSSSSFDGSPSSRRNYLDRKKLFIPINYQLIELILADTPLNLYKLGWIDFYSRGYKTLLAAINKDKNANNISDNTRFTFITTYDELRKRYNCSRSTLSKMLSFFQKNNFILKFRDFAKNSPDLCERQDSSIWQITLLLPTSYVVPISEIKNRATPLKTSANPLMEAMSKKSDETLREGGVKQTK